MSTHASITLKTKNNKYKSIYLQNDGYISSAGEKLKNYYNTYEKVDQLLNLGNLSSLGNNPIDDPNLWNMDYYFEMMRNNPDKIDYSCRTYKGRGDTDEEAIVVDDLKDINFQEYDYLFEDGEWCLLLSKDNDKIKF